MTAYLVLRMTITDAKRWAAYREAVVPLLARVGARHVTAGNVVRLEGKDEQRIAIFEFASVEAIRAFWDSPEYMSVKELRRGAAVLDAWAVPSS